MKKTLLSTTALLVAAGIATPSFANMWTLSAGVQAANLNVESDLTASGEFDQSGADAGFDRSRNDEDTNVGGELALGYQYDFNSTYNVALEVFGQLSNAQVEVDSGTPFDADASITWIAGLRVRPGFYVTPSTRFFVDGGFVLGGFELEQANATHQRAVSSGISVSEEDVDTLAGWRYGVGLEHKMTENFVMGVDYTVTEFSTYTSEFIEDGLEQFHAAGESGDAKGEYSPTLTTLGLNFKYLFGAKQQPRRHVMMDK